MENLKELRLHTLRGDIQTCGMDGLSKKGIRQLLFNRYVYDTEIPVTRHELNSVLDEEYQKVEAWRTRQTETAKGTYCKVIPGDGREVAVYIPSKEEDE